MLRDVVRAILVWLVAVVAGCHSGGLTESVCEKPFQSRDRQGAVAPGHGKPLPHGRGSDGSFASHTPSEDLPVDEAQRLRIGERPLVFGVNHVGDSRAIYSPPDYDEHMYRRIIEAGGTCVRLVACPRDIEAVRGKREWEAFDRDVALAIKYGQEPMVCIVNTPAWASPTGKATHQYAYRPELFPEFSDFCTELARRTRGKVRLFQLWNEQNGCSWHFHDGWNHADEYLPFLKTCYDGLKKGNPDCVLSMGSLDDAQGHGPIFIRKTYEEMAKQSISHPVFDVISSHPYSDNAEIMRGKLDAMKKLLEANGDEDKPFWITEYGWHTGNTKLEDQASKLAEVLAAFVTPVWSDVEAVIYLCIADFEGRADGFGLCDINLRPRPAFYALQGAERFGAVPPYQIDWQWTAADRLVVRFKTLKPATAGVRLGYPEGLAMVKETVEGTEHEVTFSGLEPAVLKLRISTTRMVDGSKKRSTSAEYTVRSPGLDICNGDFEKGFFAGIATDWRIEGEGFCTDASLMPHAGVKKGKHAQAVFAIGDKGHEKLDSTLSTLFAVRLGEPVGVSLAWSGIGNETSAKVVARAGIDATGGNDPEAAGVQWTNWTTLKGSWKDVTIAANGDGSVARLFVQCRSEGELGKGSVTFLLDDVRIVRE